MSLKIFFLFKISIRGQKRVIRVITYTKLEDEKSRLLSFDLLAQETCYKVPINMGIEWQKRNSLC